ncbi:MAG: TraR/DksA C4-type zinc finger protein [Thermodesulfobacteriota bacterium]|nr:TraR/DksA C4-type zinc finger protein [Thermodesulfobacteriota bacterium]
MLAKKDKSYFSSLLSQQLDEALRKAEASSGRTTMSRGASPDTLDRASTEMDNVLSFRMRERESKLVKKIKYSLAKLQDGTYGICEECGRAISKGRLRARPIARFCIRCKEQQEYGERLRGL